MAVDSQDCSRWCGIGLMEVTGEVLAAKFQAIFPHLDEQQRRLLTGAKARALGHGGIRAAGVREATVSLGYDELDSAPGRWIGARRPGGGRKKAAALDLTSFASAQGITTSPEIKTAC